MRSWIVVAGCAVYAALALVSGADRATRLRPAIAMLFPEALADLALQPKAEGALGAGQPDRALALAERAIRRSPLEPENAALLGAARLFKGDDTGADRAMRIAGQMGWRVPFTQTYWMQQALATGDYDIAAMRMDALLRQSPELMRETGLIGPLEESEQGRAALARRLVNRPNWLVPYTGLVRDVPVAEMARRATVLAAMARQGGVAGCEPIAPSVERLVELGAVREASMLWRGHCPPAKGSLVFDGTFADAAIGQNRSPFAWMFIGQNDTTTVLERVSGGQRVAVDSSAPAARTVVRQLVLLPAGKYALRWTAEDESGAPSGRLLASLDCDATAESFSEGTPDRTGTGRTLTVTVDGACPAHWLSFGIAPGTGIARLGKVTIAPRG